MGSAEQTILSEVAKEHDLPADLLRELFEVEREQHGMSRRSRIFESIDTVFKKDWRSREDVMGLEVINAVGGRRGVSGADSASGI